MCRAGADKKIRQQSIYVVFRVGFDIFLLRNRHVLSFLFVGEIKQRNQRKNTLLDKKQRKQIKQLFPTQVVFFEESLPFGLRRGPRRDLTVTSLYPTKVIPYVVFNIFNYSNLLKYFKIFQIKY